MSNIAPITAPVPTSRLWRTGAALARALAGLTLALFGLMLLAWLGLHWVILPHIDRWRPLIETETSRALGVPVRIGSIEVRSSGWVPSVELREVTLLDAERRPALHLPRVMASISARSMLASASSFELRLAQLLIDGAQLEARRDPAGRVFVAGIDFSAPTADSEPAAADWFFRQREFVIRGGSLRWTDEQRGAPPLALTGVDLVVRNSLRRHSIRLDATPPPAWGERFSLRGEFTQPLLARGGDWRRWSGDAFADAPRADASQLRQYLDLPFELSQGVGAARAWIELREGVAQAITLDMALRAVALRLGATLEPLMVEQLQGRLTGVRGANGGSVSLRKFEFLTGDGVRWPAGDLALAWTRGADGAVSGGELSAGRLDLAVIAHTAERLPLGEAVRTLLAEARPQGIANDVRAAWAGPIDAPSQYRIDARLSGLSLDALPAPAGNAVGRPGLRNVSIDLSATEKGGEATLAMNDGTLELPGVFAEPVVPLDELKGRLRWRIDARVGADAAIQVQLIDARLTNADAQVALNATWKTAAATRPAARRAPRTASSAGLEEPPEPAAGPPQGGQRPSGAANAVSSGQPPAAGPPQDGQRPSGAANAVSSGPTSAAGPSQGGQRPSGAANAVSSGQPTAAATGRERGERFPGTLELDATLTRGVAARAARYLPLGLPEATRRYVQQAVQGGTVKRAQLRIAGDLRDFPFPAGTPGEFRIALQADDLTLAYMPGAPPEAARTGEAPVESPWPPMTQLSGELIVDRGELEFREARAQIYGVELSTLRGALRKPADQPVLTLEMQARGPVADMLRFVDTTPVGHWLHGALREITASGDGDLKLALTLPLREPGRSGVNGSLQLAGSDLLIRRELPLLAEARGRVEFTHRSVAVVGASARVLGGEAAFDGGTQADGSLRFNAQGSVTADALRRAPELGPLARLAGALSGRAAYRLSLVMGHAVPEIEVSSDLVGLVSDLPAPLQKAAEAALPLHYRTALAPGAPGAMLDSLQIELGSVLRVHYLRDQAGDAPRVLRGGIGVFEPAPTPASGVAAAVSLERLDLDAWDAASQRLFGPGMLQGAGGDAAVAQGGYAPTQISLKVQDLAVAGRSLSRVSAGLSQLEGQWRADIDADQLEGRVEYRPPGPGGGGAQAGRVHARLARLNLPKSDAEGVTSLLDRQPASVPALDIVVDDLELRGRRLGRIEIQAVNRLAPQREWELTRLSLNVPEARLSATGRWAATAEAAVPRAGAAGRRADFQFELDIADSGALLRRLGTADAIRGGKGRLKGQVAWLGSPLALDFPSLSGQVNVAIEQGQFLQVQPGAARLLGVLSMQSLARRLAGDFRDLFQEGFVFDSVTGDVTIVRGVARTNNLLMRGVQAAVLMEGSADIAQETQDLRVVVVPEIGVGAASLAYAVINPVIGLGTFLAQWFLREPLIQASTREFHVTGPWADPQVEPVVREPGQAVPYIGPPPAAASGASSPTP